jgi:photosystem II stability/assembly factor-like uncharacterized protein
MDSILRTAGVRGLIVAGTMVLVAAMTVLGAVSPNAPVSLPKAPRAAALNDGCANGLILDHASGGGIPECKRPGAVEGPHELGLAEQQRGSIYTAGTGRAPGGVYASALAQQAALPNVASANSGWALQGKGPLDAGQPYDAVGNPFPQTIADLGLRNLTGRITDIAYDPAPAWKGMRIFASGAEGGVWESRDGGNTWRSIGDRLITQSVGAIAFVPGGTTGGDDGTLVVGTGDNAQGRYNYNGHGIFYSHDDGASWVAPTTQVTDPSQNFRIRVSPVDPHRIYAATSRGLWMGVFTPGFGSLSFHDLNLPVNCTVTQPATAYPCFLAANVTDVEVKRQTGGEGGPPADVVVANVGSRFGSRPYLTPDGGSVTGNKQTPQAGIYRSTNCTAVTCSFTYIPGTGTLGNGYPTSDGAGRVSLAAAKGDHQNWSDLYAVVQDPRKENFCFDDFDLPTVCRQAPPTPILPVPNANLSTVLDGMYLSTDFGLTWIKVMDWSELNLPGTGSAIGGATGQFPVGYGPGIQSSYNNWVLVDPTQNDVLGNPTRVLFGLEEIWEQNPAFAVKGQLTNVAITPTWVQALSTTKAVPWQVIGRYWNACGPFTFGTGINCNGVPAIGGTTTHPDQHASLFIPDGTGGVKLFAGNDGGMFQQAVPAGGAFSNDSWGNGISGNLNVLQPYNAEISKDGTIVAGLQDNGEMKIDPKTGKMDEIYGGDGLMSGIDPNNSKNIMECYVHLICNVTSDGGINWSRIDPKVTNPRFDAPLQMDPKNADHYIGGGREVVEWVDGYHSSTWTKVYDLGTVNHPGDATSVPPDTQNPGVGPNSDNSATAVDFNGPSAYVGFCGLCDVELEGLPFKNGIATNVGGSAAAKILSGDGWHIAHANGLPNRYITSVRMDPNNLNTIYVTLGGYQRVWVEPGRFGEAVDPRGGHVFKSTDRGENFTDVSGNLPNTPALWSVLHNGQLVVATDIGVFISSDSSGGGYATLGTLPATPVDTLRISPGNPDLMIAALWGRGVWAYCFSGQTCPSDTTPKVTPAGPIMPNTATGQAIASWLLVPGILAFVLAGLVARRRRRAMLSSN